MIRESNGKIYKLSFTIKETYALGRLDYKLDGPQNCFSSLKQIKALKWEQYVLFELLSISFWEATDHLNGDEILQKKI